MMAYLPFRGHSAWFSCSVDIKIIEKWSVNGGLYADETCADYLFSDDAKMKDTIRIYESQDEIAVFQTSWITEILQRQCQLHDVVLGQHLLCPHFLAPIATPEILNSRARALPSTHETYSDAQALDGGPGGEGKMTEGELWTDNTALDGGRGEEGKMTEVKLWAELEAQALACKMAEVLHVDHIRTDEKMYDFDCSKPGFVIKRIN